ncbi:MAG: hypothetical protein PQJ60_00785 [Spirochaetales bacterium]|nr:hypothetical protein [Spirochaetales bacterium]
MSMSEWKLYLDHGDEFYRCAKGGLEKPEKFNTDAVFNLTAMAIEKLSVGFLMKNSIMPEGHTFHEIAESLNEIAPLPTQLEQEIVGLDKYQESFCSLDIFRPDPMTREELPKMLDTCERLQEYVQAHMDLSA